MAHPNDAPPESARGHRLLRLAERMANIGMEAAGTTAEEYEKILRDEYEKNGQLLRRIGLRVD